MMSNIIVSLNVVLTSSSKARMLSNLGWIKSGSPLVIGIKLDEH